MTKPIAQYEEVKKEILGQNLLNKFNLEKEQEK